MSISMNTTKTDKRFIYCIIVSSMQFKQKLLNANILAYQETILKLNFRNISLKQLIFSFDAFN